ncbi:MULTISPECIES: UPF0182 family protein [Thiorhodovibrio]|uniref:UPF0182 family protein n=1 Tax=Thiorhodovibrio TaxID=61593 RepID=UPI001913C523|nr:MULTISPECIES: UPF0182 family protein [Thiorhodovibrio]MBK5969151.1 hypothetical protein [Thiorhodovibrio winogradskyi]WPL13376.1 hypothetical protein Thiosp_03177 [Thiorhodovibrio litoralis]
MRLLKSFFVIGLSLGVIIVLALLGLAARDFLVDLWWFESLGYEGYFWQRQLYRYLVFTVAAGFFFILFFANFWIGGKYLGAPGRGDGAAAEAKDGRSLRQVQQRFHARSLALYLPLALMLAVVVALPLLLNWEDALLFLSAPEAGISDPVLGHDISFYLFALPLYRLLYGELLVAFILVLLGLGLLYWREHRAMPRGRGHWRRGARLHLSLILALLILMGALYCLGDAYMLLYTDNHLPLFHGPGYEEITVTLPLIATSAVLVLATGAVLLYLLNTGKGARVLAGMAVLLLAVIGLRHTPFLTDSVGRYLVEPAEMTREAPYIENNIQATLAGYRLQDVETRDYPINEKGWEKITPDIKLSLQSIPIWDEEKLLSVYRELQEIRPYYAFGKVNVGRYEIEDVYQQVFLAGRQIHLDKLEEGRRTWVNRWLRYTHGYGLVMTPAAQAADNPIEWLIQGIPPSSTAGLPIDEAAIYYGTGDPHPVIAPNASHELDYASRDEVELTDYAGTGGVPISSLFRKLVFALYFGERNIFYTTQMTDDSRLLFRRDIRERIKTLTPDLMLGPSPYLVLANGRLYWIQDAMTTSKWYPYSKPYAGHVEHFERPFNYIRDSIKVVVDAYNGSVDYYLADRKDPIAAAHARIYPGLFKPFEEMPQALKEHVRYPKSLFDVQMDIYTRYHQTDPETFYNQEDAWDLPPNQSRESIERMRSYYLTLNLIDSDHFEYSLFAPMTPQGQPSMRALAVAGNDGESYGRIIVYNFPKGTLVYGPEQVNAFIKQDPHLSQELTLWNQQGLKATRGRLIAVPVEGVLTYIQGIFLQTTSESPLPQLAGIIASQGPLVVMASSIEEGLQSLHQLILETHQKDPVQKAPSREKTPEVTDRTGNDEAS